VSKHQPTDERTHTLIFIDRPRGPRRESLRWRSEFPDPGDYLEETGPRAIFARPYTTEWGTVVDLNTPNPLSTQAGGGR